MNLFSRFTFVVCVMGVIAIVGMETMTYVLWRTSFFNFLSHIETLTSVTLPVNFPQIINSLIFTEQIKLIVFQTIFTILLLTFWIFYFRFTFVNPVKELTKATKEITQGNLQYSIPIKSGDEIGQLTKDFNNMTVKLKATYNHLEELVDARTKALNEKVDEVEKVNRFMVDREIKMKMLKDENELLKQKLDQHTANS